jgi:hypothetical protein
VAAIFSGERVVEASRRNRTIEMRASGRCTHAVCIKRIWAPVAGMCDDARRCRGCVMTCTCTGRRYPGRCSMGGGGRSRGMSGGGTRVLSRNDARDCQRGKCYQRYYSSPQHNVLARLSLYQTREQAEQLPLLCSPAKANPPIILRALRISGRCLFQRVGAPARFGSTLVKVLALLFPVDGMCYKRQSEGDGT